MQKTLNFRRRQRDDYYTVARAKPHLTTKRNLPDLEALDISRSIDDDRQK